MKYKKNKVRKKSVRKLSKRGGSRLTKRRYNKKSRRSAKRKVKRRVRKRSKVLNRQRGGVRLVKSQLDLLHNILNEGKKKDNIKKTIEVIQYALDTQIKLIYVFYTIYGDTYDGKVSFLKTKKGLRWSVMKQMREYFNKEKIFEARTTEFMRQFNYLRPIFKMIHTFLDYGKYGIIRELDKLYSRLQEILPNSYIELLLNGEKPDSKVVAYAFNDSGVLQSPRRLSVGGQVRYVSNGKELFKFVNSKMSELQSIASMQVAAPAPAPAPVPMPSTNPFNSVKPVQATPLTSTNPFNSVKPAQATPLTSTNPFSNKFVAQPAQPAQFVDAAMIQDLKTNALKLRNCYNPGYEFPEWAIGIIGDDLCKRTVVYYDNGDNEAVVQKLATEREPVNIGMSRDYDGIKLNDDFGWRTGYYGRYYESKNTLAPNIAIYCKTPIKYQGKTKIIKCINVVGYAFDAFTQPDYQYFSKLQGNKEAALIGYMYNIFKKIFVCAHQQECTKVILSLFGCMSFAEQASTLGLDILKIYKIAFGQIVTSQQYMTNIEEISLMGNPPQKLKTGVQIQSYKYGLIPQMVFNDSRLSGSLDKVLFVNAWDPWSIVGNGNARDISLDGYFGRSTAMSLLCWPLTNPYIQYRAC